MSNTENEKAINWDELTWPEYTAHPDLKRKLGDAVGEKAVLAYEKVLSESWIRDPKGLDLENLSFSAYANNHGGCRDRMKALLAPEQIRRVVATTLQRGRGFILMSLDRLL